MKKKINFYLLSTIWLITTLSHADSTSDTLATPINTAPIGYAEIRHACLASLESSMNSGDVKKYETALTLLQGLQLPETNPMSYVNYDAGSLSQVQKDLEILAPKSSDSTANLASITDRTVSRSGWAAYRHRLANPIHKTDHLSTLQLVPVV